MLVLFVRGWFFPAYYLLQGMLVVALGLAAGKMIGLRSDKTKREFAEACLAALGLLLFLNFLRGETMILISLGSAASLFGLGSIFVARYHRGYLGFLTTTSAVWLLIAYWQNTFGV
jgi:hypothetical protein